MNKNLIRITGVNLIILLIYTILIRFISPDNYKELNILIFSMAIIIIHVVINIIIAIVYFSKKNTKSGRAYLLGALIVLLIGFSACWGSASTL